MKITQKSPARSRFFYGLAVFVFSAGTVAFVTDPYIMADVGLIILGMSLMISAILSRS